MQRSLNLSSGVGSRGDLVVLPGDVLVVDGAGLEAAVQDADKSVRELPQGCVMGDVPGAERVVVGPCIRGCAERGEGLQVPRGGEAAVGGVAGQHDALLARGAGDRALPRVVLAGTRPGEPFLVVAELSGRRERRTALPGTRGGALWRPLGARPA